MDVEPKHIPLPGRGPLAHGFEYPGEDAEAVVSGDADNLKASKTSSCLCLNSADSSGDRNQCSIVPREELKMAQDVTPGWAPASFPPAQNPWGSLACNTPADPTLTSRQAAGTGSSDVPRASSAGLGQWSLSSKQLISQTPAAQRLELGLVKTLQCLCSPWPTEDKKAL